VSLHIYPCALNGINGFIIVSGLLMFGDWLLGIIINLYILYLVLRGFFFPELSYSPRVFPNSVK